ncbi:HAD family hydrolase [Streptacidiphilus albus]|uniref:HAD family hydrolase n=1 Tax=Streptacidiphilus albus TaxID=105425 RepID=UPI00054B773B|nr:haloacid dehalogenase-like hydrolase [Streptacidiphilus albus]
MPLIILWDIDHTLIDNAGVSKEIYSAAFETVTGRAPSVPPVTDGQTDRMIMTSLFSRHQVPAPDWEAVRQALEAAGRERAEELRRRGHELAGVRAILAAVAEESGIISSVLTGNIRANAHMKLAAFGLDSFVDLAVGAYGEDQLERAALVPIARHRVQVAYGVSTATPVVVFGDTPRDVEAALTNGAQVVAVSTGVHTAAELRSAGADAVIADLTGTASLLDHLRLLADAAG